MAGKHWTTAEHLKAAIESGNRAIADLRTQNAQLAAANDQLVSAANTALRKLRGTNIMGEPIHGYACDKLRAAIARSRKEH